MKDIKYGILLKVIRIYLFLFLYIDSYITFLLYLSYSFYIFFYNIYSEIKNEGYKTWNIIKSEKDKLLFIVVVPFNILY
jgi:hypothetical protein